MPIIIAENFQYDTSETILQRYPGSFINPSTPEFPEGSFPFSYGYNILQLGKVPFTEDNNRLEVVLYLTGPVGPHAGSLPINIFGLRFETATGVVSFEGNLLPEIATNSTLHIIVERRPNGRYQIIILLNGVVVLTPTIINEWVPNSWIGANHTLSSSSDALPRYLSELTVAVDTPVGTRLNNIQYVKRELEVISSGDWEYTDTGYVEDTDKTDPTIGEPRIQTPVDTSIELGFTDGLVADIANLYANKGSTLPESGLSINGAKFPTVPDLTVPNLQTTTDGPFILTTYLQEGKSNGDIAFIRERNDFISYADLSTQLGFTQGSARTENSWLEFLIDGKLMFVSRVAARHSVSWEQIYQAGLVYGVDGPGQYPSPANSPVNQNRTIVIGDTTYQVRLLKGSDINPGLFGGSTAIDPLGSQRSEWARLMYPICTTSVPSYTGPKLANYTEAELGVGSSFGNGRSTWVQETPYNNTSNRLVFGYDSVANTRRYTDTNGTNVFGWRPCLVPID